jgi:hypothetical protein
MSSLALIAAAVPEPVNVAVAIAGGHGELFVQQFDEARMPTGDLVNLTPAAAAAATGAPLVAGSGAAQLVAARGWGEARDAWPAAADALTLAEELRSLPAKPVYARAPDARAKAAA